MSGIPFSKGLGQTQANQPIIYRNDKGVKTFLQHRGTRAVVRYTPEGEVFELTYRGQHAAKVERRVIMTMRLRGELQEVARDYEPDEEGVQRLSRLEYTLS